MPRRSRRDALTLEMLSRLARAGRVAPGDPPVPATIRFEPTRLDVLVGC